MKKTTPPTPPKEVKFTGLEAFRISLGITKKEMAELIGISQVAYGKISREGGPTQVRMETLTKILMSEYLREKGLKFTDLFVNV